MIIYGANFPDPFNDLEDRDFVVTLTGNELKAMADIMVFFQRRGNVSQITLSGIAEGYMTIEGRRDRLRDIATNFFLQVPEGLIDDSGLTEDEILFDGEGEE